MRFESPSFEPQPVEKPLQELQESEIIEMIKEAEDKAKRAIQRVEGETPEQELQRAYILSTESTRAEKLKAIVRLKEAISRTKKELETIERGPAIKANAVDSLPWVQRRRQDIGLMQKNLAEKEKEYETWDRIEQTGHP